MAAIYANYLSFITDQMIGASSDELSATVHWWFWSFFFPSMVLVDFVCENILLVMLLLMFIVISFSGLTIALSSLFLCQRWLERHLRSLTLLNILLKYSTMLERTNTPGIVVPSPTVNKMSLHDLT